MTVKLAVDGEPLGDFKIVIDPALRDAIEQALKRVPGFEKLPSVIISEEAEQLALACHLFRQNDLPSSKYVGTKAAKRLLFQLAKQAKKVRMQIDALPLDALDALAAVRTDSPHPVKLDGELKKLILDAYRADQQMPERPPPKDLHSKRQAMLITRYVAAMFERRGLSVSRVSESVEVTPHQIGQREAGSILNFLGEVFKIFQVKARPGGQLKLLTQPRRKKAD